MKKHVLPIAAAAGAAFFLASCQEVIFDTIRDEIALDDAQITGDVNSIVRFLVKDMEITTSTTADDGTVTTTTTTEDHECLFVQNGTIWMKDVNEAVASGAGTAGVTSGTWSKVSQPASNIIKLAADSTYLYALAAPTESDTDDTGENIETGRAVYYTDDPLAGSWTAVDFGDSYGSTISTSYSVNLFCTNSPQSANRHAFVNIGSLAVFELDGGTATDITSSTAYSYASASTITAGAVPAGAKSATVLGSAVYLSTGYAMTSNETYDTESTYIYWSDSDDLYYSADGSTTASVEPGDTIYSLAYTADYMLTGTDEGLVYVTLTDNVPGSTADVTNADSTLSSYYMVPAVLALDPGLSALAGDLYGSTTFSGTSASFSNVVLWGYYASRGKWNCE